MKGKILGFLAVCYVAFALVLATGAAPAKPYKQGWIPPQQLDRITIPLLTPKKKLAPNCMVLWTAKWCSSCKKMKPIAEKLREDGYTVYVFDYDKERLKARRAGVRTLPTTVIYCDGEEVARYSSVVSEQEILKSLHKNEPDYELF
ncbi:MAG: thioredoxin family protein [Planctomycetota bacterium]|jgi:thiol-disulfide isomerase/thioredoxin